MEEMASPCQVHGRSSGAGCFDYFFIANRAAGLHHCSHSCLQENLKAIGEREEGIRCGH
jgi:hypothetical protein